MSQFTVDAHEVLARFQEDTLVTLSSYIASQINSNYGNVFASVEPNGKIGIVNSNDDPDKKQYKNSESPKCLLGT